MSPKSPKAKKANRVQKPENRVSWQPFTSPGRGRRRHCRYLINVLRTRMTSFVPPLVFRLRNGFGFAFGLDVQDVTLDPFANSTSSSRLAEFIETAAAPVLYMTRAQPSALA